MEHPWLSLCLRKQGQDTRARNMGKKQRERGERGQVTEGQIKQGQEAEREGQTGASNRRPDKQGQETRARSRESTANGGK